MSSRGDFGGPSILILDCSTSRGSVALALENGNPYWRADFSAGRGHGGELFRCLAEAVERSRKVADSADKHLREIMESARALGGNTPDLVPSAPRLFLSEILVGLGPGSYSGVRQAIAAANGLAAATGARLHGFASPLALETDFENYHAVGDARRGAFYHTAVRSRTQKWTAEDGRMSGTAVVARECVEGPELLADRDALRACLASRPDWPVVAVENVSAGLPPETPVAWPSASHLRLSADPVRHIPPLEPIYLRPVSITLPKAVAPASP